MPDETARKLNELNRHFYTERAEEFSQTRRRPWKGWAELFDRLGLADAPARVLDIGCGNARLYDFLARRFRPPRASIEYVGLDISPLGLGLSQPASSLDRRELMEVDFVSDAGPLSATTGLFDFVALFGVMHHIPQRRRRRRLLEEAVQRVAPGGYLAFTRWRFAEFERFRSRILPWQALDQPPFGPIDSTRLEPGDHLLQWGDDASAMRYCHAMTAGEADELVEHLALTRVHQFLADGRDGDLNEYYVMQAAGR